MRFTLPHLFIAAILVCGLSSCRTTVTLDYLPNPGRALSGPNVFAVGEFVDHRGMPPAALGRVHVPGITAIAEVPLEVVMLNMPVSDAVRNAFAKALDARKMLAAQPRQKFVLAGEVIDLHCELYNSPYAVAMLRVNLIDVKTQRVLHTKEYRSERQSVFYDRSAMDGLPLMRDLTSRALQDSVDLAIDDKEVRALIGKK